MTRPAIRVNGGDPGEMATVTASATVTATLDSVDGVRQVQWDVIGTDETTTAASYTLVQSGSVGQNVELTAQGAGTALILRAIVNAGVNSRTGLSDAENTTATVKIAVPLANGLIVGCAGEEFESDPTFGATGIINAGLRVADGLSGGALSRYARAATTAALPANTRVSNTLTANANGALPSQDGVALIVGNTLLVWKEGGGTSHVNNGSYRIDDLGSVSTPWVMTRTTDFNTNGKLIPGITWYVQEGSANAGHSFRFVTVNATVNVTALEFTDLGTTNGVMSVSDGGSPIEVDNTDPLNPIVEWNPTANVTMDGHSVTACTGLTHTGSVAISATGGSLTMSGSTTAALSAGGGNLTLDASASVLIGGTNATLVSIGRTGQTTRLPAFAGGGTQGLVVDNSGNIGVGGGASATARYWVDATTASNANDQPTRNLAATLAMVATTVAPLSLTWNDASRNTSLDVLSLYRMTSDPLFGDTSIAASIAMYAENGAGNAAIAARIRAELTNVLDTNEESRLLFEVTDFGTPTAYAYLDPGIFTVDGAVRAFFVDQSGADVLGIGGTNATRIDMSKSGGGVRFLNLASAGIMHLAANGDASSSLIVNADVNAAAAIAGTKISPDFGSQNVTTTGSVTAGTGGFIGVSLDRASAGALALGGTTATSVTIGSATANVSSAGTITGAHMLTDGRFDRATSGTALVGTTTATAVTVGSTSAATTAFIVTSRTDNITTTVTSSIIGENATAATSGVARQYGGALVSKGHTWETQSGGSSKTQTGLWQLRGITSSSASADFYTAIDAGSGTPSNVAYATLRDPALGGTAFVGSTFVVTSNGYRVYSGAADIGYLKFDGSNVLLSSKSTAPLVLATSDATARLSFATTGAQTHTLDDGTIVQHNHGSTLKTHWEKKAFSGSGSTTNVLQFSVASYGAGTAIAGQIDLIVTMAIINSGVRNSYHRVYAFGRHNGGSASISASTTLHVEEGDVSLGATVDLSSNIYSARIVPHASTTTVCSVEWTIRYYTYTPV